MTMNTGGSFRPAPKGSKCRSPLHERRPIGFTADEALDYDPIVLDPALVNRAAVLREITAGHFAAV